MLKIASGSSFGSRLCRNISKMCSEEQSKLKAIVGWFGVFLCCIGNANATLPLEPYQQIQLANDLNSGIVDKGIKKEIVIVV